jgi:hypothetical protein
VRGGGFKPPPAYASGTATRYWWVALEGAALAGVRTNAFARGGMRGFAAPGGGPRARHRVLRFGNDPSAGSPTEHVCFVEVETFAQNPGRRGPGVALRTSISSGPSSHPALVSQGTD